VLSAEMPPTLAEHVACSKYHPPVKKQQFLGGICGTVCRPMTRKRNKENNGLPARVLKETAVTERFTEHDLRAKVGSDAESLERARQLLAHADSKITQRVYRRKPERIKPVR
jgi:integrase